MAVYTYFDGIDGLWKAVRQEGFTRLAAALTELTHTTDLVRDLAAQTWVVGHGLASLTVIGPLPREALAYAVPMLTALFTQAGDTRAHQSVAAGWTL
ncbi:hypothetical protein GCM10009745_29800 [Kribbella yunnanensis]|uniref:TetR family transcriptional regulator n=1 Tax=Kribbella yunnanensis TaxID=190194 RepID=A0ABN2H7Y3_9ACTN